ncbi:autotransporter outer membrane beta-barrel domain-containing protein [Bartonella ancashensis]|uniref:Autotransporter domain-containing protein n=1 Tax=Bartonella ancashensis TaxID=1318743 RepID=A0A0M4L5Z2_9HYPH|nr:autotransporter outer membrane beta-barrel domain-containing protein [Bartonella ancashensis]ALE02933.1 hypothetical protein PU02_0119 [Bartonella ancashensis]
MMIMKFGNISRLYSFFRAIVFTGGVFLALHGADVVAGVQGLYGGLSHDIYEGYDVSEGALNLRDTSILFRDANGISVGNASVNLDNVTISRVKDSDLGKERRILRSNVSAIDLKEGATVVATNVNVVGPSDLYTYETFQGVSRLKRVPFSGVILFKGSQINLKNSNFKDVNVGLAGNGKVHMVGGSIIEAVEGVSVWENGAEVILDKVSFEDVSRGIHAEEFAVVKMAGGKISSRNVGVHVGRNAAVQLQGVSVEVREDVSEHAKNTRLFLSNVAVYVYDKASATMVGGSLRFEGGDAIRVHKDGSFVATGVTVSDSSSDVVRDSEKDRENAAFSLGCGGSTLFKGGKVDLSHSHAFLVRSGDGAYGGCSSGYRVGVVGSDIAVKGKKFYGVYFLHEREDGEELLVQGKGGSEEKRSGGIISLEAAALSVSDNAAIYSSGSSGHVRLSKGSKISGKELLRVVNFSPLVEVYADQSSLTGGTHVDSGSFAKLDLRNGSRWTLVGGENRSQGRLHSAVHSNISSIALEDSEIVFAPSSLKNYGYQTLHIGHRVSSVQREDRVQGQQEVHQKERRVVYSASGDARLHLNVHLDSEGWLDSRRADHVVIDGDISKESAATKVRVVGRVRCEADVESVDGVRYRDVSLIQVFGAAQDDSFVLDGPYTAVDGFPYQYVLKAYGPNTQLRKGESSRKLIDSDRDFWDFRLENKYIEAEYGQDGGPKLPIRAVVPQVPTYLLLPNTLFHVDLMDVKNQHKLFETAVNLLRPSAFIMNGYGGAYKYASDLSAREYGYGADVSYSALQIGAVLKTTEIGKNVLSFGAAGSYGHLLLKPKEVEYSLRDTFDKFSVMTYARVQRDGGLYAEGSISYGFVRGDVTTAARGKTAHLRGIPVNLSLTGGRPFAVKYGKFTVEPQFQVVYQKLFMSKVRDVDGFDVNFDHPDQFTARIGGDVSKMVWDLEKDGAVSLYGKLYMTKSYGKEQSVFFKDAFRLSSFGSYLEGGVGVNAELSSAVVLHGDVLYQHRLGDAGFSGISFSGGLRYRF